MIYFTEMTLVVGIFSTESEVLFIGFVCKRLPLTEFSYDNLSLL